MISKISYLEILFLYCIPGESTSFETRSTFLLLPQYVEMFGGGGGWAIFSKFKCILWWLISNDPKLVMGSWTA